MTGPTCTIPIGWTLGQACVALCERRRRTGVDQAAKFNWILLKALDGLEPEQLAVSYWRAIELRRDATDDLPSLPFPPDARVREVNDYASLWRAGQKRQRVAA